MKRTLHLHDGQSTHRAELEEPEHARAGIHVRLDDQDGWTARPLGSGVFRIEGGGRSGTAVVHASGDIRRVFVDGHVFEFRVERAPAARRPSRVQHETLSAPMPGTVIRLHASPGDHVRSGDTLVLLEAMKMELPLRAAHDGIVRRVLCREGELVQPGVPLVELE